MAGETPTPTPQVLKRRRRANERGGRGHSHRVRVSPEEEIELTRLAETQRVSVPRLLVEAALAGDRESSTQRRAAMAELFALRASLARVGNNLNQIARIANTDARLAAGLEEALGELLERLERIDVTIDGLAS